MTKLSQHVLNLKPNAIVLAEFYHHASIHPAQELRELILTLPEEMPIEILARLSKVKILSVMRQLTKPSQPTYMPEYTVLQVTPSDITEGY